MTDFTVNWTDTHQTIDGFGASDRNAGTISSATADLLFTTTSGIGLTLLRCSFGPTAAYNSDSDPQNAVLAAARGASVWTAPWSPPGAWKNNGSEDGGGHLLSAHYGDWSDTFVSFYNLMSGTYGITLKAMSVQNEPDQSGQGYPQTLYTNAELIAFIDVLGPKLAALSPRPKLMTPESGNWAALWGFADAVLADGTASQYLDIIATHDYGYDTTTHAATTQPLWQTEVSSFDAVDASITNGLTVATWIHRALVTGGVTAWHYWEIQNTINTDNESLLVSGGVTKRLYVLGNWAKFARPGWLRIGVSGSKSGIYGVTAFRHPSTGEFAIVIVNNSGGDVSLSLTLGGPNVVSVKPYVTSGATLGAIGTDGNLSLGSTSSGIATSLSLTGNAVTFTAPNGVTTLVGNALKFPSRTFAAMLAG